MRDEYVGDIGDFGKYALLRALCGKPKSPGLNLNMGVVWYFNKDAGKHGHFTNYLFRQFPMAKVDLCVYNTLAHLVSSGKRKVSELEQTKILPVNPDNYFRDNVPSDVKCRDKWANRAIEATDGVDLIFLDPDTGIEPKNPSKPLSEYVRKAELKCFIAQNQSVVVYQNSSPNTEIDFLRIGDLEKELCLPVWMFQWGSRYFLIIPHEKHKELLRERFASFLAKFLCEQMIPQNLAFHTGILTRETTVCPQS